MAPGSVVPDGFGTSKRDLARFFNAWAAENGSGKLGERKVIQRLTSVNAVVDVRIGDNKRPGLNIRARSEAEMDNSHIGVESVALEPYSLNTGGASPEILDSVVSSAKRELKMIKGPYGSKPTLPAPGTRSPSGLARFVWNV